MIYLIVAPPGCGKTYYATYLALKSGMWKLNKKYKGIPKGTPKRTVFTNYPIVEEKSGYCTLAWENDYTKENIVESDIFIDEAWMSFSSRDYKNFGKDLQAFFALNRHNDNDIYIIAQNAARVDVIIREMVNEFYYLEKFQPFFSSRPWWFKVYVYSDLNQMAKMTPEWGAYDRKKLVFFRKKVAHAYDTHAFRTVKENEVAALSWIQKLEAAGIPRKPTGKELKDFNKWRKKTNKALKKVCSNCRFKIDDTWPDADQLMEFFPVVLTRVSSVPVPGVKSISDIFDDTTFGSDEDIYRW